MYFLMQGTSFIYQGREIGMTMYSFLQLMIIMMSRSRICIDMKEQMGSHIKKLWRSFGKMGEIIQEHLCSGLMKNMLDSLQEHHGYKTNPNFIYIKRVIY